MMMQPSHTVPRQDEMLPEVHWAIDPLDSRVAAKVQNGLIKSVFHGNWLSRALGYRRRVGVVESRDCVLTTAMNNGAGRRSYSIHDTVQNGWVRLIMWRVPGSWFRTVMPILCGDIAVCC